MRIDSEYGAKSILILDLIVKLKVERQRDKFNYKVHLLDKGGSCWGQAGGKMLAERIPVHGPGLAGGKKRSEPTGGAAYGIAMNASTFLFVPVVNLR